MRVGQAIPRHVTSRFGVALCFLNLPIISFATVARSQGSNFVGHNRHSWKGCNVTSQSLLVTITCYYLIRNGRKGRKGQISLVITVTVEKAAMSRVKVFWSLPHVSIHNTSEYCFSRDLIGSPISGNQVLFTSWRFPEKKMAGETHFIRK